MDRESQENILEHINRLTTILQKDPDAFRKGISMLKQEELEELYEALENMTGEPSRK